MNAKAAAASVATPSRSSQLLYTFKGDDFSSHTTILKLVGEGRGRRILDVGAADGFLAERLTQQGWQVTAIERDRELAVLAKQYSCETLIADLNQDVPALPNSFDAIVCGDVLEHLVSPEDTLEALMRYLVDDGVVIISVPNVAHLYVRFLLLFGRFDYADRGILDRTHLRFFTLKTFQQFFHTCHLEMMMLKPVPLPLFLAVPRRFHGRWLQTLYVLSAFGARCWPRGLAYQFVAIGRRRKE